MSKFKVLSREICRGWEEFSEVGVFENMEDVVEVVKKRYEDGWGDEYEWEECMRERIEEMYKEDGRKGWVYDVDEEEEYWVVEL